MVLCFKCGPESFEDNDIRNKRLITCSLFWRKKQMKITWLQKRVFKRKQMRWDNKCFTIRNHYVQKI